MSSRSKLLTSSLFVIAFSSIASFLLIPHDSYVYAQEFDSSGGSSVNVNPPIFSDLSRLADSSYANKTYTGTPYTVTIAYKDSEKQYVAYSTKTSDILSELNITDTGYKTVPSINENVGLDYRIQMIALEIKYTTKLEAVDFDIKEVNNSEIELGTSKIMQKGVKGEITTVMEHIYEDGLLVESIVYSRELTKQPITEIIENGTKIVSKTIILDGKEIKYCKKMTAYATVYDAYWNCHGRPSPSCKDNVTGTGAILKKGVIAVKKGTLPLKTEMYVPGYGYGKVLDYGGGYITSTLLANKKAEIWIDLGFDNILTEAPQYKNWSGIKTIYLMCDK